MYQAESSSTRAGTAENLATPHPFLLCTNVPLKEKDLVIKEQSSPRNDCLELSEGKISQEDLVFSGGTVGTLEPDSSKVNEINTFSHSNQLPVVGGGVAHPEGGNDETIVNSEVPGCVPPKNPSKET